MKFVDYLGLALKSDPIIDLINLHDLQVIYNFDVFREGASDTYAITAASAGFEMQFDKNQVLEAVFCYVKGDGEISPIDHSSIGVPLLHSLAEVRAASDKLGGAYHFGEGVEFLDRIFDWGRIDFENKSWHFEFENTELRTISFSRCPPGV